MKAKRAKKRATKVVKASPVRPVHVERAEDTAQLLKACEHGLSESRRTMSLDHEVASTLSTIVDTLKSVHARVAALEASR